MPIQLNRFTSEVMFENNFSGEGGLAKGSHFDILINFPSQTDQPAGFLSQSASENLTLRCDSVSFPSRAALTSNIKYFGPERRKAYGFDGAPVTTTVLLSQN